MTFVCTYWDLIVILIINEGHSICNSVISNKVSYCIWFFYLKKAICNMHSTKAILSNLHLASVWILACRLQAASSWIGIVIPSCSLHPWFSFWPKTLETGTKLTESQLFLSIYKIGAQWLRGRVLDSRPKGRGFEPRRRHCVVSLSKNNNPSLVLAQPRKTRPFLMERLLLGSKESNQTNKSIYNWGFVGRSRSTNKWGTNINPQVRQLATDL